MQGAVLLGRMRHPRPVGDVYRTVVNPLGEP